jgi:hypothetical protein
MTAEGVISGDVVTEVNGETGDVDLDAADVGADPAGTGASAAASAVGTHTVAADPHGDRTFATAAVTAHTGAADPHGDRTFATGAVGTHAVAADPHGDRAFATAAVNALDTDITTRLEGYQPNDPPVVTVEYLNSQNFVSGESLNEGLALKLDKANGEVVDSTLTVRKSDNTSALRFRSTGGAVDIDKTAGDVVISSFAGATPFTGAQTPLVRLRANGITAAGLTEFGSTVYTAEQSIDAATGVASLGAKNGATNIRMAGYLDISTAPTTGTWTTGDVVMTRLGMVRCTAGGTPGTWALLGRFPEIDAGFTGWMYQPGDSVQAGLIIPTGGLSFIMRFRAMASTIGSLQVHLTVAPTGITNAFCSLHDDSGLVLSATAKSANRASDFTTGGMKTMPLGAVQTVTPGAWLRARFWWTTTTSLPTLSRACNSSSPIINPNQPTAASAASTPLRWATGDSGLTDMASAPDQISNITGHSTAYWCGALPT